MFSPSRYLMVILMATSMAMIVGYGDVNGNDNGDECWFTWYIPPDERTFGHRLQEEEPLANACLSHLVSHLGAG